MTRSLLILFLSISSLFAGENLANRYYVSDVLLKAFGDKGHDIVYDNIMKNGQIFGGSCDFYEQVRVGEKEFANPEDRNCLKGKQEYGYKDRNEYSKFRESLILQSCNALIKCPECYQHLLDKIAKAEGPVQSILSQFFWNDRVITELLPQYQKVYDRYFFKSKKVKMTVLNACIDPRWQKI